MSIGDDGVYHPDPSRRWQNRKIRDSDIARLRAAGRVGESSYAIARRKRSEKLDECRTQMLERKSSILTSMSQSWLYRRWHEQVDGIDVTSPGAEDELNQLRVEDVRRTKGLYSGDRPRFDPPEWWAKVIGSVAPAAAPPTGPAVAEGWDEAWTRTPLGAELQAREEARKAAMEAAANDLASLESSLGVLISDVRLYAHYRDLPLETYLSM